MIAKLKMAGIQSVFDLAISIPHQLVDIGGGMVTGTDEHVTLELVTKAKKALVDSGLLYKDFSTAQDILEEKEFIQMYYEYGMQALSPVLLNIESYDWDLHHVRHVCNRSCMPTIQRRCNNGRLSQSAVNANKKRVPLPDTPFSPRIFFVRP